MKIKGIPPLLLFISMIIGFNASAVDTLVTVRFANPSYDCATQTYSLDVEYQCNQPNQQLFGMNVRFFYPDNLLEFISFDDFIDGYGISSPYPPIVSTGNTSSGMTLFGFPGAQENVNGGFEKNSDLVVYLSTSGWTRIFSVYFHVDDPVSMNSESFCPPVIWDLNEQGTGGINPSGGIVMTLVVIYPNKTAPVIERCDQYNWQYDGVPGLPHGYPVATDCINTICAYAPDTYLPVIGSNTPGFMNVPVTVTNFDSIQGFNLSFEYDPAVLTYVNHIANAVFNETNGILSLTDSSRTGGKRKITMNFDGNIISLSDDAHITDIQFSYLTGTTSLTWLTGENQFGYIGKYGIHAYDQPLQDYYFNGKVISLDAPITKIDTTFAADGNFFTFTARVWGFNEIGSGHLTLNYNPAVLGFVKAIPAAEIATSFTATAGVPGNLVTDWTGNSVSLEDGSVLMYHTFQYSGGASFITWNNSGSSCQYINAELDIPMDDDPTTVHYSDGYITNSQFNWTGGNSGEWNNPANWENNMIPVEPVDVLISPAANPGYWPVIEGDLHVGEDCKNLYIMNDAQLTVTGDCIIHPGYHLEVTGSGCLKTGGDWINSGLFTPGTGTVEFFGPGDSYITDGVDPANYISSYQLSTFPPGIENLTGAMPGPTGDDEYTDVNIGFSFSYLGISYSQARISTNGWISLNTGGTGQAGADNMVLFISDEPHTVIAPWWDNLLTSAEDNIRYKTEGTAPSRVFVVNWINVYAYRTSASAKLSFSVRLYETSNIIEFSYGNIVNGTHNPAESASIGIKDMTGGPGHYREATQNSSYLMLGALNSQEHWPSVNYRFTPPAPSVQEVFNQVINVKTGGNIYIQKNVVVSGNN